MTDWELILKDSEGFEECKESAVEGGTIAKIN